MSLMMPTMMVGNRGIPQSTLGSKLEELAELEFRFGRFPLLIKGYLKVENVFIMLINSEGNWVHRECGNSVVEDRNGQKISDYTLVADGLVSIIDTCADSRILNGIIKNSSPELRSYIGHPLETKGGSRIGVLCAWGSQPRLFTEDEQKIFEDAVFWIQRELSSALELERAADIQRSFLPESDLQIQGYEIAGFCQPHFSVGGDFYDWFRSSNGVAFTLGDVMGKGIGSAIMAASVRAAIRATSWDHGVLEGMKIATQVLESDLRKAEAFVTLIHGQLDTCSHLVSYVDAGHGLTMHLTKNGKITRMDTANFPIGTGLVEEWEVQTIEMAPGDTLLMLSDGFLDMFEGSMDRLNEIAEIALTWKDASEIVVELQKIVRGSTTPDDVTALVLRRN